MAGCALLPIRVLVYQCRQYSYELVALVDDGILCVRQETAFPQNAKAVACFLNLPKSDLPLRERVAAARAVIGFLVIRPDGCPALQDLVGKCLRYRATRVQEFHYANNDARKLEQAFAKVEGLSRESPIVTHDLSMHRASVHRSGRLGRDADKGYIREHESYYLGFFVPCGVCSIGVALAVRLLASVWKVVWKIDISVRETSFLTAATLDHIHLCKSKVILGRGLRSFAIRDVRPTRTPGLSSLRASQ
jgi:hypothetical protein